MAFISFDESMKILNSLQFNNHNTHKRYLLDCLGFVLAKDIRAFENSPVYETSAMDGYAFKHKDISLEKLYIKAINPAGKLIDECVNDGECIKTFTGSLMPKGADTLIPIELVSVEDNHIIINQSVKKGFSVRAVGEIYKKDEKLIAKGERVDFAQIGVMAGLNIVTPTVYTKPKVSILSTGSELLELGEEQTSISQIRSTNNYILEALICKYGGEPLAHGVVGDDKKAILEAFKKALHQSDIIVSTGGVSVGDFDFVKDVVHELGFEVLFKGVNIKPGQHIMVARMEDKFIVALAGFAYSATLTALLYLVPLMAKFQHLEYSFNIVEATLKSPFKKKSKKMEFWACDYRQIEGRFEVDFNSKKEGSSAILTNMLGDTAIFISEENDGDRDIGDVVKIMLL